MTELRIAALSGSLRAASINTARLREIAARAPDGVVVELLPIDALPLFNPDLEATLPAIVASFRARITAADCLIIASPEYAHGISGVLKNALDWLVGATGLSGKPVLVLNTAPRAIHADAALRETLATMAATVIDGMPPVDAFIRYFAKGNQHAPRI